MRAQGGGSGETRMFPFSLFFLSKTIHKLNLTFNLVHFSQTQKSKPWELDFAIHLVSESFKGKTAIARHRMVNALLKPEFDERGLHALSLRLKTPEEWEKEGGGEMR